MRFLVILIIALLAFYFLWPEPEPVPVEETFIGDQVKALHKAEKVEDDYLKAVQEQQKKMEQQLDDQGG